MMGIWALQLMGLGDLNKEPPHLRKNQCYGRTSEKELISTTSLSGPILTPHTSNEVWETLNTASLQSV